MENEDTHDIESVDEYSDDISSDLAKAAEGMDFNEDEIETKPVESSEEQTDEQKAQAEAEAAAKAEEEAYAKMTDEEKAAHDAAKKAEEEAASATQAPDHWSQEDKAIFNELSKLGDQGKRAQEFLLNRHKAMEADYTRKTQELAEFRNEKEQYTKMLEPYRAGFQAQGMKDVDAVNWLVNAHGYLERDPVAALQWLVGNSIKGGKLDADGIVNMFHGIANTHNLDLAKVAQVTPSVDPAVQKLSQEVQDLRKRDEDRITEQQKADFEAKLQIVTSFAEEKDDKGELKRPYFDEVAEDVIAYIRANKDMSLEDAYNRAIYANPQIREKILASEAEAKEKKRLEEAKKKADEAKRAGNGVEGEGGDVVHDASNESVEDTLARNWSEV